MPPATAFYIWKKKVYRHIIAEIGAFFNQTSSLRSKKEYYIWNFVLLLIYNIAKSHFYRDKKDLTKAESWCTIILKSQNIHCKF